MREFGNALIVLTGATIMVVCFIVALPVNLLFWGGVLIVRYGGRKG